MIFENDKPLKAAVIRGLHRPAKQRRLPFANVFPSKRGYVSIAPNKVHQTT